MRAARRTWFEGRPDLDPDRLVFLDEAAATTTMARRCGRAPRGQRCRVAVPLSRSDPSRRAGSAKADPEGHRKTTTVTAAPRTTGLVATASFEGATNGERFRGHVSDPPVPVLEPGDIVVRDDLRVHEVAGVREAIEAAGARLLLLPPYSPDFNPIEQAFAKLEALRRGAAARTVTALHAAIQQAFDRFSPQECRDYITAAGYEDDAAVTT